MIFDEATLRKLNRLTLVASRVRAGAMKGERRSTRRGAGVEFADYRDYVAGDDLRRVDWNIYARLDRLYVKLREEEEDLAVHLLVDASRSMNWGEEPLNKFTYALKLAAALGTIALATGDPINLALLRAGSVASQYGPARGQQHLLPLLKFLEAQQPDGATDLGRAVRDYTLAARRPGLAVVLSDLFTPTGYESGLAQLQGRGYEVVLIHLLAPDEIEPPLAGDLRLLDVETGQAQEVSLDGGLRDAYRRRVQAWRDEIQAYCRRRGIRFLGLSTERAWDEVVLSEMRQVGIVK